MNRIRAGTMMVETMAAVTLVMIALVGVSQLVILVERQHRVLEARRMASLEAANLMEQALAVPYGELTDDRLNQILPSADVQRKLKNARATFRITPLDDQTGGKQIELNFIRDNAGGDSEVERLVAWKYSLESSP